jgi:hypothetical protein
MTEEKKTEQPVVIAEALINTAVQLGQEQGMRLVELLGHMEIAKLEVFSRNIQAAAAQAAAPAEGDGKPEQEDASLDGDGDKA